MDLMSLFMSGETSVLGARWPVAVRRPAEVPPHGSLQQAPLWAWFFHVTCLGTYPQSGRVHMARWLGSLEFTAKRGLGGNRSPGTCFPPCPSPLFPPSHGPGVPSFS